MDSGMNTVSQADGKGARGLTSAEAERRQQQFGLNELPRHQPGWIRGFLAYFWGPIPWLFMLTAGICVVTHLWMEVELVGAGFVTLALLGCAVEFAGRRRVLRLRIRLERRIVSVQRDGVWKQLPARELVPGDLIRLKGGDIVPADVHLVGGDALAINVVHPNVPISRIFQKGDLLYCGSPIRFGEAEAVVVVTGANTRLGKKMKRLVDHLNAHFFYDNAVLKFDKSVLQFDEPLGGEWGAVDLPSDGEEAQDNLLEHDSRMHS